MSANASRLNFTSYLVIDSSANANCDQTYFLRCFKSCVSFLTWKQNGTAVWVETTPDMFTGYLCDCSKFAYALDVTAKYMAIGPADGDHREYKQVTAKMTFDGKLQMSWELLQSSASCSATYCVSSETSETGVLGVQPSVCYYGSTAYYFQSFWWVIVLVLIFCCCCCCFARRRRIFRRNDQVGLDHFDQDGSSFPHSASTNDMDTGIQLGSEEHLYQQHLAQNPRISTTTLGSFGTRDTNTTAADSPYNPISTV